MLWWNFAYWFEFRFPCWKTAQRYHFTRRCVRGATTCPSRRNGRTLRRARDCECFTSASGPATSCTGSPSSSALTRTHCTTRDSAGRARVIRWLRYLLHLGGDKHSNRWGWAFEIIIDYFSISKQFYPRLSLTLARATFGLCFKYK